MWVTIEAHGETNEIIRLYAKKFQNNNFMYYPLCKIPCQSQNLLQYVYFHIKGLRRRHRPAVWRREYSLQAGWKRCRQVSFSLLKKKQWNKNISIAIVSKVWWNFITLATHYFRNGVPLFNVDFFKKRILHILYHFLYFGHPIWCSDKAMVILSKW